MTYLATTQPTILSTLMTRLSPTSRHAYARDIEKFFGGTATPEAVADFVTAPRGEKFSRIAAHHQAMIEAGLSRATQRRRMSAICSLVNTAYEMELIDHDSKGLTPRIKYQTYKDTRGIDLPSLVALVRLPLEVHPHSIRGLRDHAMLSIMANMGLRRFEVVALDRRDFEPGEKRLWVRGKGQGDEAVPMTIPGATAAAVQRYLDARCDSNEALFVERRKPYDRITTDGVYFIVNQYGRRLGIPDFSPHKIRHSMITAAAAIDGVTVPDLQKLARHAKVETTMKYVDNLHDRQGKVSGLLEELVMGG